MSYELCIQSTLDPPAAKFRTSDARSQELKGDSVRRASRTRHGSSSEITSRHPVISRRGRPGPGACVSDGVGGGGGIGSGGRPSCIPIWWELCRLMYRCKYHRHLPALDHPIVQGRPIRQVRQVDERYAFERNQKQRTTNASLHSRRSLFYISCASLDLCCCRAPCMQCKMK